MKNNMDFEYTSKPHHLDLEMYLQSLINTMLNQNLETSYCIVLWEYIHHKGSGDSRWHVSLNFPEDIEQS